MKIFGIVCIFGNLVSVGLNLYHFLTSTTDLRYISLFFTLLSLACIVWLVYILRKYYYANPK